jgi:hypothetical protein
VGDSRGGPHPRSVTPKGWSRLAQQLRQFRDVSRDPPRLIFAQQLAARRSLACTSNSNGPLGHRLGLASLMAGLLSPLPCQLAPRSSSSAKQPG